MVTNNPLVRALKRLSASTEELDSSERQRAAASSGATRVGQLCDRELATLRGSITMLTIKPRAGTAWLEAEFNDGSGAITLIWMGRREIPGVTAGRELVVTGRVSCVDGHRRLYNPRYELIAG